MQGWEEKGQEDERRYGRMGGKGREKERMGGGRCQDVGRIGKRVGTEEQRRRGGCMGNWLVKESARARWWLGSEGEAMAMLQMS